MPFCRRDASWRRTSPAMASLPNGRTTPNSSVTGASAHELVLQPSEDRHQAELYRPAVANRGLYAADPDLLRPDKGRAERHLLQQFPHLAADLECGQGWLKQDGDGIRL